MRIRRTGMAAGLSALALLAGACSSGPSATSAPASGRSAPSGAPRLADAVEVPLVARSGAVAHHLTLPRGWTASVWASVPGARIEAWTPGGDLLVSQPALGQVTELVPSGGAAPPVQHVLVSGLTYPQGLAFARWHGSRVLYVAESDEIDRYQWRDDQTVGRRTVLVAHLPDLDPSGDDVHRAKDVVVAPDGTIYFNVSSSSNADPDDRTMHPERAVIMAVDPDGTDLRVVERGVRNGEGLAVAPDGVVWTAINERDMVPQPNTGRVVQSYVDNHPPDEVVPVTQGRDLGWPYCNPDQDLSHPAGSLANVPLVHDAVTNPGGKVMDCAKLAPIQVGLPAHSAPVGLTFLEGSRMPAPWSHGALVAVHGSWDRQPPRPPAVLWMAWNPAKRTLEPAVTLVGGFQDSNGSRWGRPVDAVPGPDGALYVSDDLAGAIYRIVPR